MKRFIVIPARFDSTRLPGKPLKMIAGKPLIAWVLEKAEQSKLKERTIVATDDERIKNIVTNLGFEARLTRKDIASGTERVYEAIKEEAATYIVNLQGDEPFMRGDMIDMLFSELEKGFPFVSLARPLREKREYEDPNEVKVVLDKDGFALYFSRSPIPHMRKKKIPVYIHIGIYGFTKESLHIFANLKKGTLEEAESLEQLRLLENGYKIKMLVTEYDGFGIDTEEDLKRAEAILKENKHGKGEIFSP